MQIHMIVAVSDNGAIGKENQLPWHLPEDLKHFKALTMGHPMIMGRLTYESIGRPLPGRKTIVLTRDENWAGGAESVVVVNNIDDALTSARREAVSMGVNQVYVVGGAKLYQQFLPLSQRLNVTEVHIEIAGDAHFPVIDFTVWKEVSRCRLKSVGAGALAYSFVEYVKCDDA